MELPNIFSRDKLANASTQDALVFRSPVEFSEYIETISSNSNENLTQTLLAYSEVNDINYEDIAKMFTPSIKEKVKAEMQYFGLMEKTSVLEFGD